MFWNKKYHICTLHCSVPYHIMEPESPCTVLQTSQILTLVELECATQQSKSPCYVSKSSQFFNLVELKCATSSQSHIAMCYIAASAPLSRSPILCSPAPLFPQPPSPPNPPQTLQMYVQVSIKKTETRTKIY